MSPFFTIYGGVLLVLQYLAGFKIGFEQLNFEYSRRTMEQIGISINDYQPAINPLLIKVKPHADQIAIDFSLIILVVLYDFLLVNTSTICQSTTNYEYRSR
jgi:hypothetical protein